MNIDKTLLAAAVADDGDGSFLPLEDGNACT